MLKQLLKHSLVHAAGRISGLAIGVVSMGLLARYLGQEQFGWYVVAFTWLQFFSIAVDFGLYMIGLKMLGENESNQQNIFSQIWWLRILSAFVLVLVLPNIVWLLPYTVGIKIGVTALAVSFFFANLNQLLTISFQKQMRMQFVAVSEFLGKLAALGALYLVIIYNLGFVYAMLAICLYGLVQLIILFSKLSGEHKIKFYWNSELVVDILKQTWPLGVIIILNTLYFKADTLILSWFASSEEVGLYGAPYKILEILVSFPVIYLGLLLPEISKWWRKQEFGLLHSYAQQSLVMMAGLASIMTAGTIVFAKQIMTLIAGVDFISSGVWLQWLVVAAWGIYFGQLFGFILVGISRQKIQMKIYLFIAILSLVLYIIFIPQFGTLAAAIITIIVEFLAMFLTGWFAVRITGWRIDIRPVIYFVLLAAISGWLMMWLDQYMYWMIALILGSVVYILLSNLFKLITISQIKSIFLKD
ncbi:MAG: flippase [Proteobacteria bacterium]|nr:flippase [Pseudomonadota bacterium]